MFDRWRTAEGLSSYDVLANAVDALPRTHRTLDLACGDGHLLHLLSERGFANLAGVDMSPDEIAAARRRLGDCADLSCQEAGALSFANQSIDAVVCHLALMLMEPVEPVLGEILRVLRSGGSFFAVVNRYVPHPVLDAYRQALHRITKESGLERLRMGDARVFGDKGLTELLLGAKFGNTSFSEETIGFRDFDVLIRTTPPLLWSMLRLAYDVFRLSDEAQAVLEAQVLRRWSEWVDNAGQLTCCYGLRLLACRVQ